MKKYNPDGTCIKCGGGDIEDVHKRKRSKAITEAEEKIWRSIFSGYRVKRAHPERIARTCKNCGYLWHELPMDGVDKKILKMARDLNDSFDNMMDKVNADKVEFMTRFAAPVIEVGDVVAYENDTRHWTVLAITDAELIARDAQGYGRSTFIENISDLTLIRKGPKVHRFEGVENVEWWEGDDAYKYDNDNPGSEVIMTITERNKS